MPAGRPKITLEEIETAKEHIINFTSDGMSLKAISELDKETYKIPCRRTIYNWLNSKHEDYDKTFLYNYTRAREESGDLDFDKIGDIVFRVLNGKLEPNQARVAIDALKWVAGRKRPLKYGDMSKLDITTGGKEIKSNIYVLSQKDAENINKLDE